MSTQLTGNRKDIPNRFRAIAVLEEELGRIRAMTDEEFMQVTYRQPSALIYDSFDKGERCRIILPDFD